EHTPRQPHSGQPVQITASFRPGSANLTLQYQVVEPGAYAELKDSSFAKNWVSLPMQSVGNSHEEQSFQVTLPADLQKHRRLVRYRFNGTDSAGQHLQAPSADSIPPNYAYFVYDGVPAWTGAINPKSDDPKLSARLIFPPEVMSRVQIYHLIGKK